MVEKSIQERISVIETKVDEHTYKLDKFFEKLDQHILEESENDHLLQSGMNNLTEQLMETNNNLRTITEVVTGNNIQLIKIDTAWATILKLITVIVVLISAGWAVYTFAVSHHVDITTIIGAK